MLPSAARRWSIAIALAAAALGGCARGTPSSAKLTADALRPAGAPPARFVAAPGDIPAGAAADGWLASFAEPRLEALVAEAIIANPDLAAVAARRDQAAARARQAGALLWPQLSAAVNASWQG